MPNIKKLISRLANGEKIILAGACGTEILRRGVETKLPLWSAEAVIKNPEIVQKIHEDYISAGADIITTNTFRTNRRTFEKINKGEDAKKYTLLAVELAFKARQNLGKDNVFIGGAIAPLEDCYQPESVPPVKELEKEHREQVEIFAQSDVDFIILETMNSIIESRVVLEACKDAGIDTAISFVCNKEGKLLSGETLEAALKEVKRFEPFAVLTNCRPPEVINKSVDELLKLSNLPVGVYANGDGCPCDIDGWKFTGNMTPEKYLENAKRWLSKGVQIIGGCCGTNPEYIRLLKERL